MATPFSYAVPNWREGQPSAAEGALLQQAGANNGADGSAFVLAQGLAAQRQGNQDAYLRELMQQHQFAQQALDQHTLQQNRELIASIVKEAKDNPGALGVLSNNPFTAQLMQSTDQGQGMDQLAQFAKNVQDSQIAERYGTAAAKFGEGGLFMSPGDALERTGLNLRPDTATPVAAALARSLGNTTIQESRPNTQTGGTIGGRTNINPNQPIQPQIDRLRGIIKPPPVYVVPKPGASGAQSSQTVQPPAPTGVTDSDPSPYLQRVPPPADNYPVQPGVFAGSVDGAQAAPVPAPAPAPPSSSPGRTLPIPQAPAPGRSSAPPVVAAPSSGAAAPTTAQASPVQAVAGVPNSRQPDGRIEIPDTSVPGQNEARRFARMAFPRLMAQDRESAMQVAELAASSGQNGIPVVVVDNGQWKYLGADGRMVPIPLR